MEVERLGHISTSGHTAWGGGKGEMKVLGCTMYGTISLGLVPWDQEPGLVPGTATRVNTEIGVK